MKVFISWSGERSKAVANALRDWLPLVLQQVEPWVSDKDISAGDRWAQAIAGELETSNFGIICITPENLNSEWILFESGALSKSMLDAKVIPLLFGLELSDLSGPLSQFQALKVEEDGIMDIVKAINQVAENKASDDIVAQLVPTLWPTLNAALEKIPATQTSGKSARPQREILEELVSGVRNLNVQMRDLDSDDHYDRSLFNRRRKRRLHPAMLQEIAFISRKDFKDPLVALLIVSGLIRQEIPWMAEILTEGYREMRDAKPSVARKSINRIRNTVMGLTHGPIIMELLGESKSAHMLVEELPMF